jgi:hypothetical protein
MRSPIEQDNKGGLLRSTRQLNTLFAIFHAHVRLCLFIVDILIVSLYKVDDTDTQNLFFLYFIKYIICLTEKKNTSTNGSVLIT